MCMKDDIKTYEAPMRDHMEHPMENDPLGHRALGARIVAAIPKANPATRKHTDEQ